MYEGRTSIEVVPLFDLSNVTDTSRMFEECTSLVFTEEQVLKYGSDHVKETNSEQMKDLYPEHFL